ncbi:MAG: hypothetical protein ACFB0B_12140 [Thermonemataceae bacterium]
MSNLSMITVGSVSREEATQRFYFLERRFTGRKKAIQDFTHAHPEFNFWIDPTGKLWDAREAQRHRINKLPTDLPENVMQESDFLKGHLARQFEDQIIIVHCDQEALIDNQRKLKQLVVGIAQIPVFIHKDALVISDQGDLYGTLEDIERRLII